MSYHILLIGKDSDSTENIYQTLNESDYHLDKIFPNDLKKLSNGLLNPHLFLVDTTDLSKNELDQIFIQKHDSHLSLVPVLALVDEAPLYLRYKLIELGVDDYLTVPYDKLDLKVRVKANLNSNSNPLLLKTKDSSVEVLQILHGLLQRLNQSASNSNITNFKRTVLERLVKTLNAQFAFYFELEKNNIFTLKYGYPEKYEDAWKLDVSEINGIEKAINQKEPIILNGITTENPTYIYLNSILNVPIRSLIIYPIIPSNGHKAILMMAKTGNKNFSDFDNLITQTFAELISYNIHLDGVKDHLNDGLNKQAWKFYYGFLDRLINQLEFGIIVIDEDLKIKYLNEVVLKIFNVSTEQLLHRALPEIINPEDVGKILDFKPDANGFRKIELEIELVTAEKALFEIMALPFLDKKGEADGYIISFKDITLIREIQEESYQRNRMASLGVMASGIAHEIRNPLAGIKAIAQTFEDEFEPNDPQNEYVERIVRQVNRLDDLLKTLFSYAKPRKPNRRFYSIESILQDVIHLVDQNIKKKNIKLKWKKKQDLPEIFVDSDQIQQVLINLILNSIESFKSDGEIIISIKPVNKNSDKYFRKPFYYQITKAPHLEVRITDSGCGISENDLENIFNPFFTTKSFGTGLGLSIVYQIIRENNGFIFFESELNSGTECHLFLPAFNYQIEENASNEK